MESIQQPQQPFEDKIKQLEDIRRYIYYTLSKLDYDYRKEVKNIGSKDDNIISNKLFTAKRNIDELISFEVPIKSEIKSKIDQYDDKSVSAYDRFIFLYDLGFKSEAWLKLGEYSTILAKAIDLMNQNSQTLIDYPGVQKYQTTLQLLQNIVENYESYKDKVEQIKQGNYKNSLESEKYDKEYQQIDVQTRKQYEMQYISKYIDERDQMRKQDYKQAELERKKKESQRRRGKKQPDITLQEETEKQKRQQEVQKQREENRQKWREEIKQKLREDIKQKQLEEENKQKWREEEKQQEYLERVRLQKLYDDYRDFWVNIDEESERYEKEEQKRERYEVVGHKQINNRQDQNMVNYQNLIKIYNRLSQHQGGSVSLRKKINETLDKIKFVLVDPNNSQYDSNMTYGSKTNIQVELFGTSKEANELFSGIQFLQSEQTIKINQGKAGVAKYEETEEQRLQQRSQQVQEEQKQEQQQESDDDYKKPVIPIIQQQQEQELEQQLEPEELQGEQEQQPEEEPQEDVYYDLYQQQDVNFQLQQVTPNLLNIIANKNKPQYTEKQKQYYNLNRQIQRNNAFDTFNKPKVLTLFQNDSNKIFMVQQQQQKMKIKIPQCC